MPELGKPVTTAMPATTVSASPLSPASPVSPASPAPSPASPPSLPPESIFQRALEFLLTQVHSVDPVTQRRAQLHMDALSTLNPKLNAPESIVLKAGASVPLPVTLEEPDQDGASIVLTSSNILVATVTSLADVKPGDSKAPEAAVLTGVAPGTANIVATANGYQAATTAVVVEPPDAVPPPQGVPSTVSEPPKPEAKPDPHKIVTTGPVLGSTLGTPLGTPLK